LYVKIGKVKTGKSTSLKKKDLDILRVINTYPEGLRAKNIKTLTNICQRTLYNHLENLKSKGFLKNIYPLWFIAKNQATPLNLAKLLRSDKIQSHKFSFILKLIDKPHWWEKRENKLMKLKEFHFKPSLWGNVKYQNLGKDNFLIQTFSNSIVIINQKEYYANDPYDCFIQSLEDTLEIYRFIEERFNFRFFKDAIPQLSIKSHHYVKLNDDIANRCKKSGNMFRVEIEGKLRAWVDLSEPFGLETGHKNYAVEDQKRYTDFVSDIIDKNPPHTSELAKNQEFITNALKEQIKISQTIQGNQAQFSQDMVYYGKKIKSHIKAIERLSQQSEKNVKVTEQLALGVQKLRTTISFPKISVLDSIKPLIKSISDIFKPDISKKIRQLSPESKEELDLWLIQNFQS